MNSRSVLRESSAGKDGVSLDKPAAHPAERQVVRAMLPQPKYGTFVCRYCGRPTFRSKTCKAHRDLPQLEYGGLQ